MIMEKQIIYQGPGVLSMLLVAFIVLKLCGVITWSWWWVFSPLLIPLLIIFIVFTIIGVIISIKFR